MTTGFQHVETLCTGRTVSIFPMNDRGNSMLCITERQPFDSKLNCKGYC